LPFDPRPPPRWWRRADGARQHVFRLASVAARAKLEDALGDDGEIAGYVPSSAYLVVASPEAARRANDLEETTWSGVLRPSHVVAPELWRALVDDADRTRLARVWGGPSDEVHVKSWIWKVNLPPVRDVDARAAAEDLRATLMSRFKKTGSDNPFWFKVGTLPDSLGEVHHAEDIERRAISSDYERRDGISVKVVQFEYLDDDYYEDWIPRVLAALSERPYVHWIENVPTMKAANMQTSSVIQTGAGDDGGESRSPRDAAGASGGAGRPVWDAGLTGRGQLVGVGDSGLDVDSCWLRDRDGNAPGSAHRKIQAYLSEYGDDVDGNGHGTHVVASICGDADAEVDENEENEENEENDARRPSDFDGMAKHARVVFTDIGVGDGDILYLPTSMEIYYSLAYDNGARVHSDSWGNDAPLYDGLAREVDDYAWRRRDFLPVFAAGNFGGHNGETLPVHVRPRARVEC